MSELVYDKDMLALLPPWYREVFDYQQICQTEEAEFSALEIAADTVHKNLFFQTMDISAVEQWEAALGIIADPTTETLADRRQRLIIRLSTRPPFTMPFLFARLDELIGVGQWYAYAADNVLYLDFVPRNRMIMREIRVMVERIKPAHVGYVYQPSTTAEIEICEEIYLVGQTHNYVLGAWALGEKDFVTEESTQMIKPASETSVKPAALTAAAQGIYALNMTANYNYTNYDGSTGAAIADVGKVAAGRTVNLSIDIERTNCYIDKITVSNGLDDVPRLSYLNLSLSVEIIQVTTVAIAIKTAEGSGAKWAIS